MRLPVVVVPVFNAFDQVKACLESLRAHSPEAEMLIIDDASSDSRIEPLLDDWSATAGNCRVIRHQKNLGFVRSANRGMQENDGNIILLNSDTVVTTGWLQALSDCLASDNTIATATPWTNNGEIASFPDICISGPIPEDPDAIATVITESGTPEYPEIPTAIGFCMAVSRAAIDAVGYFDAELFGHGYGEENDFSLRAREAGFRNVLCDNAYVAHHGGSSFQALNMSPGPESMKRLLSRHPGYLEQIDDFIRTDPLARRRSILATAARAVAA